MKKVGLFLSLAIGAGCAGTAKNSGYQGLGRESVDEKTLAKYAPPALESNLSRKIQSLLDIRSPGMGMLAPNKRTLFFSWGVTGTQQIWKMDGPKTFPIQLTGGEDSTSLQDITADGKWLILSRDRNGEENPGLYLQSTSGGPLQVIQHVAKVQTVFEFASRDGQEIYFRANDIKPDSYAIYKYNIAKKTKELIFSQDGYWVVADHKRSGQLLLAKIITNTAAEYYDFNPKTKELKPVIGQNEKEDYQVSYSAKEGQYFVLTPKLGEFRRLYLWDMKTLKPVSADLKWDVSSFKINLYRNKIVYSVNEGGYTKIRAIDANSLQPISLPSFPTAEHVFVGEMTDDGSHVMLGVSTATAPRVSYSYDFSNQKLTQWVLPSQPEIDTSGFVKAKLEYYPAKDGTQIPMFVRRPQACMNPQRQKPCSVVVHFHGGPEAQSVAGFSVFAQLFNGEEMIFVEPNVRGSDGYGKTWLHSDNGPKRLDVVSDIEDAALFMKKNWAINGQQPKVGVIGWSYGGYAALMAMTYFSGSYDVGVSLVGISNLNTFLMNTAPYRRALRIPEYGDPVKDAEALKKLSPTTHLSKVKAPLMVIQGATDPRVPVGEAIQIHQALQKKDIPSPLIIFADEGHGAAKRSNKVLELGHALNFLKTHLQP